MLRCQLKGHNKTAFYPEEPYSESPIQPFPTCSPITE